jgi:hypothetical protein
MCAVNAVARNTAVVMNAGGQVVGMLSWEGFRRSRPHRKVTDDDVMAFVLLLSRRGLVDQAEELLERYLAGYKI